MMRLCWTCRLVRWLARPPHPVVERRTKLDAILDRCRVAATDRNGRPTTVVLLTELYRELTGQAYPLDGAAGITDLTVRVVRDFEARYGTRQLAELILQHRIEVEHDGDWFALSPIPEGLIPLVVPIVLKVAATVA